MINTTETVRDIEVPEGRRLLHEFYHERRLKHTIEFRTMVDCWRLCTKGREVQLDDGRRVRFESSLGAKLGTRVFLEEIVGKYYYNFIQGVVYGGAMLVLVAVALYLAGMPVWVAFAGFAIEAVLLLVYAITTAYSPIEDPMASSGSGAPDSLMTSLNSSVREMTNAISDLVRLVSQTDIRQDVLLTRLSEFLSKANTENTRLTLDKLEEIHSTLKTFTEEIALNQHRIREEYLRITEETERTLQRLHRSVGEEPERARDDAEASGNESPQVSGHEQH